MPVDQPRTPPPDAGGPMLTRRSYLKAGAGAAAGGAVLSGSEIGSLDLDAVSPTGEADALGTVGTGVLIGATIWIMKEYQPFSAESTDETLSADIVTADITRTTKARKSNNASTFVDNENMVQYMPEAAYSEGKLAALEAMDNGATSDACKTAGLEKARSHMVTIEKNLLKSWNESVLELRNTRDTLTAHDSLTVSGAFDWGAIINYSDPSDMSFKSMTIEDNSVSVTLRDGSTLDVETVRLFLRTDYASSTDDITETHEWSPTSIHTQGDNIADTFVPWPGVSYLKYNDWNAVWDSMQTTFTDIEDNISLFVDNVYDKVQAGEIDIADAMSGVDLGNSIAAEDSRAQAIGDLIALNIPGDYGHETTIRLKTDDATMQGYLATTDTTNVPELTEGQSIDPSATDDSGNDLYGTWYIAYEPGSYIEDIDTWDSSYGVQDGLIRFTEDPTMDTSTGQEYTDVTYQIDTTAGETAEIGPSAFSEKTDDTGSTYWEADLSEQLNTLVTGVDRIRRYYSGDQGDTYAQMIIDQPFEIVSIAGADSLDIQQQREPQTDNNYYTEEEWNKLLEQQKELLDRLDEATTGGGTILDGLPTLGFLPSYLGGKYTEWAIVGLAGLVGINTATS